MSGVLDLSSDSENDSKVPSGASQQSIPKDKGSDLPTSSQSPSTTTSDSKTVKPGAKAKKKDISNLSDSEHEGADEKENSCRTPEVSNFEPITTSTSSSRNKAQKSSVSSSALSILSPLTPSSENKEKEQCTFSRASDTEPELKRARMDSGANNNGQISGQQSSSTNSATPLHSTGSVSFSSAVGSLHAKSLFSPTRGGHDNELLDFDSELYDLARSVSADYSQCDEDGGMGGASGSLPFSFSQSFLCREDNGEDSAQATLNLVEKLRIQHARKSGCPRSSMDGSDLSMIEDGSKSPTPSVRLSCEKRAESSQSTGPIVDGTPTIARDENVFEDSSKSVGVIPTFSPGRDKSTQGDERWVPPSTGEGAMIPSSSPRTENESERNQKSNKNLRDKINVVPTSASSPSINASRQQSNRRNQENLKGVVNMSDSNLGPGQNNQFHQVEEDAHRRESERTMYSEISDRMKKKEMQIENQNSSKESLHVSVASTASSLPTSTSLTTTSPVISPGIKLPHGTQSMHFNHAGQNLQPGNVGFPAGSPHPPFMYPMSNTPSVANVVNALAASMGPNNPHSSFFRPHAQHSSMSQQPTSSSLSPGYPRQGFTSTPNFLQSQQSESHLQQKSKGENIVSPPSGSPGILSQRRPSNFMEEKSISDSLVSGVTSGMPPLAKPSIASPSMILAANNVKNIIPPPPPQSTVAQIIENVVNNHANNSGLGSAQDILSAILNITQPLSNAVSSSGLVPSSTSKLKVSIASSLTQGLTKTVVSSMTEVETRDSILLNGGVIGSSKAMESMKPFSLREQRDYDQSNKELVEGTRGNSSTSVSPRGRGRRATTPRAAAKTDKVLTACETNGVKGKGRGDRKSSTNTSPARAKPPATRRGGGRGRGRGKGLAVTRKDLAGTVYDIDFDEFEENHDEKLDLRMLRERRKSSDIHVEGKATKSEILSSPSDHRSIPVEVLSSPKHRELDITRVIGDHQKIHNQSYSSLQANENIVPIPQPPLPGPVDMRTYSVGSITSENISTSANKGAFTPQKETRFGDILSTLSSSTEKASIKNEYDELDEALDALAAAPKASPFASTFVRNSNLQSCVQQYNNHLPTVMNSQIGPPSLQSISREPLIETLVDSDLKNSIGDFSRNQLKVKIKGPFLDANYGSHTIPGDISGSSQHYQSSFHHSAGQSQAISAPTNNLRRMRKKELLRQYWTQDMNMDGSSCAPGYEAEISGISANSMAHPLNRSVITIPKAVASMAIIPTKDDYRLESMPNMNDSPYGFGGMSTGLVKDSATEKRKRNRGMREMAALGIITCDTPRERRRDRMDTNLSGGNYSSEMMGKKRGKANKRPVRSTFIPPTLVDPSEASSNDKKGGIKNISVVPSLLGANAMSTVVQTLNHPTPKLKIKFGDLSKSSSGGLIANPAGHNHVLSDSSDKEAPNKKAKGRPPKKRGISEIISAAPPTMEELKRQNMKFRELVMQDFAVEERKEILSLKGTRKHKKHKRKGGLLDRETDETGRPKSPEVKVIAEGSKLILRFGKNRTGVGAGGNEILGSCTESKLKIAPGEGASTSEVVVEDLIIGENDSGFTGSSEGSSGSVSELTGASKERLPSSSIAANNCSVRQIKTESSPLSMGSDGSFPVTTSASIPPPVTSVAGPCVPNHSGDSTPQLSDVKPRSLGEQASCSKGNDKIMPIRLKLSRCGYALQQKPESCPGEDGPTPTPPPKQSDSCEVR